MVRTDRIAVRRETISHSERRSPLTPDHVRHLADQGIETVIEPSPSRIFTDLEFQHAGAVVQQDLSDCPVVLGVKEMPTPFFRNGRTYMFFSHTHKGQDYNMPMLRALLRRGATLIDYELIADADGRRKISFGRFAGLAGMIDALCALGQRFVAEGTKTPLSTIAPAHTYDSLPDAMSAVAAAGRMISTHGLHPDLPPLVCGLAGTGSTARGALEIFDLLPVRGIAPGTLADAPIDRPLGARWVYKVVYDTPSLYERIEGGGFDRTEYDTSPGLYRERLSRELGSIDLLIHAVYWEERCPRLVSRRALQKLWSGNDAPRLRVIADISCDIRGSVEATLRSTTVESPTFLYVPDRDETLDVMSGPGPLVLARDNLPCELPREASGAFGAALAPYVPKLLRALRSDGSLDTSAIPEELRSAVIVDRGELTPRFQHLGRETGSFEN